MADARTPTYVTFVTHTTGEISILLDDSQPTGDDCITLPIAMRNTDDILDGIHFLAADADRLQEWMAARAPANRPGVK